MTPNAKKRQGFPLFTSIKKHHVINRVASYQMVANPAVGNMPVMQRVQPAAIEFWDGLYRPDSEEQLEFLRNHHGFGIDYFEMPEAERLERAKADARKNITRGELEEQLAQLRQRMAEIDDQLGTIQQGDGSDVEVDAPKKPASTRSKKQAPEKKLADTEPVQ